MNTLFLAAFTYTYGFAGRRDPRLGGGPFPDHGKAEPDEAQFVGGNYATPHPAYYADTSLKIPHAPDHGSWDLIAEVLPAAKKRGMKVYCVLEDQFPRLLSGIEALREVDLKGRQSESLCPLNADYRALLRDLVQDYCKSYAIDGIMWASERAGPFTRLYLLDDPYSVACFCDRHQRVAKSEGVDVARALEGYHKLAEWAKDAAAGRRPTDGYFVSWWNLLLRYPEVLAWERLWTDSKHSVYKEIHDSVKKVRPEVQVGFHIWHENSFSPFVRAEQTYRTFADYADFLKVVAYNNCGGPRYAAYVDRMANTLFRDIPADEVGQLFNRLLNYGQERPFKELSVSGLSADYVEQEIKRAVDDVQGHCKIYGGIDVDIPTLLGQKKTTPKDVYDATTSALRVGADGVIFSRKYSEMNLNNLAGGGRALEDSRNSGMTSQTRGLRAVQAIPDHVVK